MDGFFEHLQRIFDNFKEEIEFLNFLEEKVGHGGEEFIAFAFEVIRQRSNIDTFGKLIEIGDDLEEFVLLLSSWGVSSSRFKLQNGCNVIVGLLNNVSEISVDVQAEDFRLVVLREHPVDGHLEVFEGDTVETVVAFIFGVKILVTHNKIRRDAFLEHCQQADPIPVISDSAAIVDLANHVPDGLPVDVLSQVVQENLQCA